MSEDTVQRYVCSKCYVSSEPCIICHEEQASIVFKPCLHKIICRSCFYPKRASDFIYCPYCGQKIEISVYDGLKYLKEIKWLQDRCMFLLPPNPNTEPDTDISSCRNFNVKKPNSWILCVWHRKSTCILAWSSKVGIIFGYLSNHHVWEIDRKYKCLR